ncbi:MAG: P-loop NTPase family protein [Synechococcales bacterium]|nr:P-loop NTPase family protein [Synechococcales bacterium]
MAGYELWRSPPCCPLLLECKHMVSQLSRIEPSHSLTHRQFPHVIEGLIQVFTCPHRSFFTNVMAQAFRVAGQGTPVLVVQFLKGGIQQGPDHPVQMGQHLDWLRCDIPRCVNSPQPQEGEVDALQELWQHTQRVVLEGNYSLVVLDELSLAIRYDLIPLEEVLTFLKQRPNHVDVILTGPDMPDALMDLADQVTHLRRNHRS